MIYLIHQAIDRAAGKHPDYEAVRMYDQSLNYEQLAQRSNQLARTLQENGVKRRDRVGIYLNKSLESAIAIYGILKAGAVYVPLDPATPFSRLSFVIQDCGIRHIITQKSKIQILKQLVKNKTSLKCVIGVAGDSDLPFQCISWADVANAPSGYLAGAKIIGQDLAYIIYTSGSTGNPKGIMHTHHSGLSFAKWAAQAYGLHCKDRLSNQAPLHFDMSIFDFFAAAVAGAATVIIPDEYLKLPASYTKLLQDERISVFFTVPFALSQFLSRGMLNKRNLSALRWVIFGGDTHSPQHIRALMKQLPETRFSHMYGPAETNGCTYQIISELSENPAEPFHIGKACEGMEALVLDETDQPVAPGENGELLLRGPTMMQGYWNRPDLNKRAFYYRQAIDNYEDKFYRTGDLVEILTDGNFKFLGRKDRQIKTRGFRVELDEIEMALLSHPAVEESAVFAVSDENGSHQIEAAVILKQNDTNESELIKFLKARLAKYAVPQRITLMETFPRTATGKADRRALINASKNKESLKSKGVDF